MGRLLFIRAHNCPSDKRNQPQPAHDSSTEQIQLLEQAFQQQTTISITILEGNQFSTYTGSIHTLSASELLLKSDHHYHRLLVDSIIFIESEETAYETYSD